MSRVHCGNQVYFKHTRPVARFQLPKREPKLARSHTDGKHHVIHLPALIRKCPHLLKGSRVAHVHFSRCSKGLWIELTVKSIHPASFIQKTLGDRTTYPTGSAEHGDRLPGKI